MLRPGRLLAVARYEMRTHMTGRQAMRLLGVAAALLLPAGLVHTPRLKPADPVPVFDDPAGLEYGPPPPPRVHVRGAIPPGLESRFVLSDRAPYELRGTNPVTLVAPEVTPEMRSALETIDGPAKLEFRSFLIPGRLPGRSLLIAILAISLLTGPLADSLPGERARRTLEVLLTCGITRGELIGGKWLAWTMSASMTAAFSAALACWRGVQPVGWWLAGLPLFVGSAVALGLWLVRLVDDVVGGSAAPMRVLPVAAGTMAAIARLLAEVSPVAAAAVPLGGPLMLAADLFNTGAQAAAAAAGTIVFVVLVLARTGADLDRVDVVTGPNRWGAIGLSAVATVLWWLTVAGPGVWNGAGTTTNLVTPIARSMAVGGVALLACAVIAIARDPRRSRSGDATDATGASSLAGLLASIVVGAALAASGPLPALDPPSFAQTVLEMLDRLREAAVPAQALASSGAILAAAVSIFGQCVLFRGVVARRAGWIVASLLWCFAACPAAPWSALAGSFALGALASTQGWMAALLAQVIWSAAASAGVVHSPVASLTFQMIALTIVLASPGIVRGVPIRHQL